MQGLLTAYKDQVDEIRVADLNQEVVQAYNSLAGVEADRTVQGMSRCDLADRLGLVKSGQTVESDCDVDLPQAFLTVFKSK